MNYIDNLIRCCEEAKIARPRREFEMSDLDDLNGINTAIYVIEDLAGFPEDTFAAMSSYKTKKLRACPKLNSPSKTMYVGSSTTGVKKRVSQHLGKGPKSTYSLHLSEWFSGQYKITIKEYDVELAVLQIIEDALSHSLKPAFGKQGGNGK